MVANNLHSKTWATRADEAKWQRFNQADLDPCSYHGGVECKDKMVLLICVHLVFSNLGKIQRGGKKNKI